MNIMPNINKSEVDRSGRPNSNKKITEFVTKLNNSPSSNNATKRSSSILSPPENMRDSKKLNIEQKMDTELEQDHSRQLFD